MDPRTPEPIGLSEQKDILEKHSPVGDEAADGQKHEQVVQRVEDNPRAASPNGIKPCGLEESATVPIVNVSDIPVIPPTFSSSNWARRNARVQKAKHVLPKSVRFIMRYLLALIFVVWTFVAVVAVALGPGIMAMVLGNVICKAVGLPHYRQVGLAVQAGGWGGLFAAFIAFAFVFPWGRIPSNSTREDGHFPILLLWIPYFYIDCILAGAIGYSVQSEVRSITRREAVQMAAIGGPFVAIFWVIIPLVILGLLQVAYQTLKEIAQGFPEKDDPSILPSLYLEAEALVWLLTPLKKSVAPERAPTNV